MTKALALLAVLGLSLPAQAAYPPIYLAETLREGSASTRVLATGHDRVLVYLGGQTIGEWSLANGWRERVLDLPLEDNEGPVFVDNACLFDDGSIVLGAFGMSHLEVFYLYSFDAEPNTTSGSARSGLTNCASQERGWTVSVQEDDGSPATILFQDGMSATEISSSPRGLSADGRFVLDRQVPAGSPHRLDAYEGGFLYGTLAATDGFGEPIDLVGERMLEDGGFVAREDSDDRDLSIFVWNPWAGVEASFRTTVGHWVGAIRSGQDGDILVLEARSGSTALHRWWPLTGALVTVIFPKPLVSASVIPPFTHRDRDDWVFRSPVDPTGWRWATDLGLVALEGADPGAAAFVLGRSGLTFGSASDGDGLARVLSATGAYRDLDDRAHSFHLEASDGSVLSVSEGKVLRWTRLCEDPDGDGVCGDEACTDGDLDGVCDDLDLCAGDDATGDADGDGICEDLDGCWGDDTTGDLDLDGVCDDLDLCAGDDATGDADGDGICEDLDGCWGDDHQGDSDRDGVCDDVDACYGDDGTEDADGDGICDDADLCFGDNLASFLHYGTIGLSDSDRDGVCDDVDACYGDDGTGDADGDGICDDADLCLGDNALGDADGDGVCGVEACEDTDGDGLCDEADPCPLDLENDADGDGICEASDNCANDANADQLDSDGDGRGDACEPDSDGDGVVDDLDNCPFDGNPTQADRNGNGRGDACDADSDGDGVSDDRDACLGTPAGVPVGADGCSVDQACPCDNPWKNKGAYQSCVAHKTDELVGLGVITGAQKGAIVSAAARSSCGKR